jgi:hypothetical protein
LPSYEVEYRDGVTLLVPVTATEPPVPSAALTKLSMDALRDLLILLSHKAAAWCGSEASMVRIQCL